MLQAKMDEILQHLLANSKNGSTNTFETVDVVEYRKRIDEVTCQLDEAAAETGLTNGQILKVVDACDSLIEAGIDSQRSQQARVYRLLNVMLPCEEITEEVVINYFGLFSRMTEKRKTLMLNWILLLIRNNMCSRGAMNALQKLYPLFFHYLDHHGLRRLLCRVLFVITRRRDITLFRCTRLQQLVNLGLSGGQDVSDLLSLGDLYQQYASQTHIMMPKGKRRDISLYCDIGIDKKLDAAMKAVLKQSKSSLIPVKRNNENCSVVANPPRKKAKQKGSLLRLNKHPTKKQLLVIPDIKKSIDELNQKDDECFVWLSELKSVEALGYVLASETEDIALPDRCSSVLRNKIFQHWLSLCPDRDRVRRTRSSLPHMFEEEFFAPQFSVQEQINPQDNTSNKQAAQFSLQRYLFQILADFSDFMQETMPEMEQFIIRYLETWNGCHHTKSVLRIISRMTPQSYEDLYCAILKPLHRIFCGANVVLKARIISSLTTLLQNWALIDWDHHYYNSTSVRDMKKIFQPIPGGIDHFKVMFELICFLDQMTVMAFIQENDHPLLQVCATTLYHTVANLNTKHQIPFVLPPSPSLVYRMLMSTTAIGVSSICGLLCEYKQSFQSLKNVVNEHGTEHPSALYKSGLEKISVYNSYILDFCNALWKSNPVRSEEQERGSVKSLLCRHARDTGLFSWFEKDDILLLQKAFNLTDSIAFVSFLNDFMEHHGLQEKDNLSSEKKTEYLVFLSREKGCKGIVEFLVSFIKPVNELRRRNLI